MAITNGYATLDEAKEWVGLTDVHDDVKFESAVTSVSRWIDQHCARHFWQADEPRVFEACSPTLVRFGPFGDLSAVTLVETDTAGDGTFSTVWDAGDYQLEPRNVTAAPEPRPFSALRALSGTFPPPVTRARERVRVTGTWGWANVPAAVHQACLIQASRVYKRRSSPEGVTGFGSEFGPIRLATRLDPDVAQLLAPYRHPATVMVA